MATSLVIVGAGDVNSDPISGARLQAFEAGTTTPIAMYTDSGLGTPTTNPLLTDSLGRATAWLDSNLGDYKLVLRDAVDTVTLWEQDNITPGAASPIIVVALPRPQQTPTFNGLLVTGNIDLDGNDLLFDVDADSYLHAAADDDIRFVIGGTDALTFNAAGLIPTTNGGYALGADANRFSSISTQALDVNAAAQFDGTVTFGSDQLTAYGGALVAAADAAAARALIGFINIDESIIFATQAEAEGGTNNANSMNPLLTRQATSFSLANGTYALLGINGAVADTTNRLSVKSPSVLFDAVDAGEGGTGDCRVIINKEAEADTASHLFQRGFSGRAEVGLTGDDDFHIRVSPDDFSTTFNALTVNKDNGNVTIESGIIAGNSDWRLATNTTGGSDNYRISISASGGLTQTRGALLLLHGVNEATNPGRCLIASAAGAEMELIGNTQIKMSGGGVLVGAPTGGVKGSGTINAEGVYDDNILLTDLILEFAATGAMQKEKWKNHPLYREVNASWFDPDAYAAHWKAKYCLPGMRSWDNPEDKPSVGEANTRLTAVVETLAVLIDKLNQRVKALEEPAP